MTQLVLVWLSRGQVQLHCLLLRVSYQLFADSFACSPAIYTALKTEERKHEDNKKAGFDETLIEGERAEAYRERRQK